MRKGRKKQGKDSERARERERGGGEVVMEYWGRQKVGWGEVGGGRGNKRRNGDGGREWEAEAEKDKCRENGSKRVEREGGK